MEKRKRITENGMVVIIDPELNKEGKIYFPEKVAQAKKHIDMLDVKAVKKLIQKAK